MVQLTPPFHTSVANVWSHRYIDADLSYLVVENGTEFNLTRPVCSGNAGNVARIKRV